MFILLRGGIKLNYGGRKMKEKCCDFMLFSRSRFKLDLRLGVGGVVVTKTSWTCGAAEVFFGISVCVCKYSWMKYHVCSLFHRSLPYPCGNKTVRIRVCGGPGIKNVFPHVSLRSLSTVVTHNTIIRANCIFRSCFRVLNFESKTAKRSVSVSKWKSPLRDQWIWILLFKPMIS